MCSLADDIAYVPRVPGVDRPWLAGDPRRVGFAEDVDRLREYVRTAGRVDYGRMWQVSPEVVQVEFIANAETHAAEIARLVEHPARVRVVEGHTRADRSERARRFWEPIQEQVAQRMDECAAITTLRFGYDDEGPLLHVGIYPHSAEASRQVTAIFAAYRTRIEEEPPAIPLGDRNEP